MPTSDDGLARIVADAVRQHDPVPRAVVDAAKAAYTWRTIDDELAELVYDSSEAGLVGVRAGATARQLTFRAAGVEIEVMVAETGERRLVGQVVPPQQASVEVRTDAGVSAMDTDELGRFSAGLGDAGRIQVAITTSQVRVITGWVDV